MTEQQQVTRREAPAPSTTPDQGVQKTPSPDPETIYVPDVDIRDGSECIRLEANMPGVDQQSVDVRVENGVLTLEGLVRVDAPQGYELVGQECGAGRYRRDFTLSDDVDIDGIKARVRQGVLELTLPKRDKIRTRTVEIET